jgi:hypothetical protein
VETSLVDLLSLGLIGAVSQDTNDSTNSLRVEIAELCLTLLPNVIGLSDAFGFTDWELDRYYPVTSVYVGFDSTNCLYQVPLEYMMGEYMNPYGIGFMQSPLIHRRFLQDMRYPTALSYEIHRLMSIFRSI